MFIHCKVLKQGNTLVAYLVIHTMKHSRDGQQMIAMYGTH